MLQINTRVWACNFPRSLFLFLSLSLPPQTALNPSLVHKWDLGGGIDFSKAIGLIEAPTLFQSASVLSQTPLSSSCRTATNVFGLHRDAAWIQETQITVCDRPQDKLHFHQELHSHFQTRGQQDEIADKKRSQFNPHLPNALTHKYSARI